MNLRECLRIIIEYYGETATEVTKRDLLDSGDLLHQDLGTGDTKAYYPDRAMQVFADMINYIATDSPTEVYVDDEKLALKAALTLYDIVATGNRADDRVSLCNAIIAEGVLLLPYHLEVIQALSAVTPTLNATTGYYEWKDTTGDIDKVPEPGRCYNPNGVDQYVTLDSAIDLNFDEAWTIHFKLKPTGVDKVDILSNSASADAISIDVNGNLTIQASTTLLEFTTIELDTTVQDITITNDISGNVTLTIDDATEILTIPTSETLTINQEFEVETTGFARYAGLFGEFYILDADGKITEMLNCEETAGLIAYNSFSANNGTIEGYDSGFFAENNNFGSEQNRIGYTDGVALGYIPIAVDEDGASTHLDVLGATPTYDGRVKNNAKLVGSWVGDFNGTDQWMTLLLMPDVIATGTSFKVSEDDGTTWEVLNLADAITAGIFSQVTTTCYIGNPAGGVPAFLIDYAILATADKTYKYLWSIGAGANVPDIEPAIGAFEPINGTISGLATNGSSYVKADERPHNLLEGFSSAITLNGDDKYIIDPINLGDGDYYYYYKGNIEKTSATVYIFSNGSTVSDITGVRTCLFTSGDELKYNTDTGSSSVSTLLLDTTKFSNNDCIEISITRVNMVSPNNLVWACKNLTTGIDYSGIISSIAQTASSTKGVGLGGSPTELSKNNNITLYNFKAGVSVDDLILDMVVKTNGDIENLIDGKTYSNAGSSTNVYAYIPAQAGNTGLDVNGLALTNPQFPKFGHNRAETTILNYPNPNLISADVPQLYLYDASGVPKNITHDDIDYVQYTGNPLYISFADAEKYRKRNLITYLTARTTAQAAKIMKYTDDCFSLVPETLLYDSKKLCTGE